MFNDQINILCFPVFSLTDNQGLSGGQSGAEKGALLEFFFLNVSFNVNLPVVASIT